MKLIDKILTKIEKSRPIILNATYVEKSCEFENKTAIVFGGGSGIGLAIANELRANGARVIVCGRRSYNYDGIVSEVIDVSKIEQLSDELQNMIKKHERVDFIINSQGILTQIDYDGNFYSVDIKDFEEVMKTNLESVFFINQFFCKYFDVNGIKGKIINICSTTGLKGNIVPYGLSKAALVSLTMGLGKKMIDKGIVISGIAPGATATKMMGMDSSINLRRDYIPSQRANTPLEVARLAHFLCSDAGNQMCGQIITIDGGESLH
jgi:3-oxoacyl-[acyl-carrier protein] reductase